MTKPHVVFFGFDEVPRTTAKVFLRGLLYSTSARGQVIEGMFARICQGGIARVFSFWGYGETDRLSVGSGMFVGQTGVAVNHHFVLSVHEAPYEFAPGPYVVEVYARIVGWAKPQRLQRVVIEVTEDHATALRKREGVLFELSPGADRYDGHASQRQPPPRR